MDGLSPVSALGTVPHGPRALAPPLPALPDAPAAALADRHGLRRSITAPVAPLFQSASQSFRPQPYRRGVSSGAAGASSCRERVPPPDPCRDDPDVLFIHPPFRSFPGAEAHPYGLTYTTLVAESNWFLDPDDFAKEDGSSPYGIVYPAELEPPRGWLPQKKEPEPAKKGALQKETNKQDADSADNDGGDDARLRCTFCRRCYSGVNAKSMWRRHVYEKHKIAMSNRREGFYGRSRGKGTGSINYGRDMRKKNSPEATHFLFANYTDEPLPDSESDNVVLTMESNRSSGSSASSLSVSQSSVASTSTSTPYNDPGPETDPPKTPGPVLSQTDEPTFCFTSPRTPGPLLSSVLDLTGLSMSTSRSMVPPMSPYNPTRTPAFRHSPVRPATQALRFPTSTLPFFKRARETALSTLVRQGVQSMGDLILSSPCAHLAISKTESDTVPPIDMQSSDWVSSPLFKSYHHPPTRTPSPSPSPIDLMDPARVIMRSPFADLANRSIESLPDDLCSDWLNFQDTEDENTIPPGPFPVVAVTHATFPASQNIINPKPLATGAPIVRQKGLMDAFLNANDNKRAKNKRKGSNRPHDRTRSGGKGGGELHLPLPSTPQKKRRISY